MCLSLSLSLSLSIISLNTTHLCEDALLACAAAVGRDWADSPQRFLRHPHPQPSNGGADPLLGRNDSGIRRCLCCNSDRNCDWWLLGYVLRKQYKESAKRTEGGPRNMWICVNEGKEQEGVETSQYIYILYINYYCELHKHTHTPRWWSPDRSSDCLEDGGAVLPTL